MPIYTVNLPILSPKKLHPCYCISIDSSTSHILLLISIISACLNLSGRLKIGKKEGRSSWVCQLWLLYYQNSVNKWSSWVFCIHYSFVGLLGLFLLSIPRILFLPSPSGSSYSTLKTALPTSIFPFSTYQSGLILHSPVLCSHSTL